MKINPELRKASQGILDELKESEKKNNDLYRGLDSQVSTDPENVIEYVDLDLLDDNPNNHFHRIEGEAWTEFVASIKEHGIITPLIVRPVGERYEILAGHNRKYGGIEAGLKKAPCRIIDADDVDASVIVAITNKQRENTTDLEWGWAYRTTYEALKHQGARSDLKGNQLVPNVGTSSKTGRTIDILAEKYGVSKGTIQNKIRLTFLIPQLYGLGLEEGYSQKMLIDLSYLSVYEQDILTAIIQADKFKMTDELAAEIRAMHDQAASEQRELKGEDIAAHVSREAISEKKPPRPKKYAVDEHLFPQGVKKGERENYIFRALRYIIENDIEV